MDPDVDRLAREALAADLQYVVGLDAEEARLRCEEMDAVKVEALRDECAHIKRDAGWLMQRVATAPPRRPMPSSRSQRMRSRESHRGRAGHRRGTRTRAGPSDDDGPAEPPPAAPRLTLAPPPKTLYTFGALALDRDLWAEIR